MSEEALPPIRLKTDPKYGHFPWWPEDGNDWVHPDDVAMARSFIPGPRIWCRDGEQPLNAEVDQKFVILHYGTDQLRVRPRLWQEIPPPEFALGDWIEVRSRLMTNDPHTGRIREVLWDEVEGAVRYQISVGGKPLERRYEADDLKHVEPTKLQTDMRLEPPADDQEVEELVEGLEVDETRRGHP